jgi:hypothetical protein
VQGARTLEGLVVSRDDAPGHALRWVDGNDDAAPGARRTPLLVIDGNRDGRLVLFDHRGHEARLGDDASCAKCHHMNMPLDQATSCWECHRDMYEPTPTFSHGSHVRHTGGNDGCVECHHGSAAVKSFQTSTACAQCHEAMAGPQSTIIAPTDRWNEAAGYMDAMHGLCIACHKNKAAEDPLRFPTTLAECRACHDVDHAQRLRRFAPQTAKGSEQ